MRTAYHRLFSIFALIAAWLAGQGIGIVTGVGPMLSWLGAASVALIVRPDAISCLGTFAGWFIYDSVAWGTGVMRYQDPPAWGTLSFFVIILARSMMVTSAVVAGSLLRMGLQWVCRSVFRT